MSLVLNNIGHRFEGGGWLFRSLSYEFNGGNTYGIVGPSGSGKSTLLGLLAGSIIPVTGEIARSSGGKTSWVFQNPHGVRNRTALDHVALPLLAQSQRADHAEQRALELLETFKIAHLAERPFRELSGGEAQRLMFARGMAAAPDLLLIDEPTAQLDPEAAEAVNEVLISTAQEGTVVVVATHDERTKRACHHVIDLSDYRAKVASGEL